jgi:photosynthetic reaction center cytochrome c subunit
MNVVRGWRVLAGLLTMCLLGTAVVRGQAGAVPPRAQAPILSEQAFKNVQVLRGIPVKEFMETMGFFSAALALNCSDCHGETTTWASYADDTPLKQTSRRMVLMVNAINRANFGGARNVTCFTCHRGSQKPKVTPSLALQYSVPPDEDPDEIVPNPSARVTTTAQQILDRYTQAIGGAAAAAKLTSYTAKGTYEGFDSDFEKVAVDVYAKAPDLRATVIHMRGGDSISTYDGREAWTAAPPDLTPVTPLALTGASLDGARLDALLGFPGQARQALTDWRNDFPRLSIDNRPVDIVEGKTPAGAGVKLYFDKETGFLVRSVRYSVTAVGTVPITVVYSDYRDVPGVGVKMPYTWQVTWTNGRGTYNITSLQPNVAIDAARFGKPAQPGQPRN